MVCDDEVVSQVDSLVDNLGCEVEGHECAVVGSGAYAEEEAGVVVVFLILGVECGIEP